VKGTEVRVFKNWLYVSDDVGVYRYALKKGELAPHGRARDRGQRVSEERQHADKTFALDPKGTLYINVGAPSNSCQEKTGRRFTRVEPVSDPREIRRRVGVRRHEAQPDAGERQAFCHRHAQCRGHRVEHRAEGLFSVIHGRDSLDTLFPALYNAEDNATRQAEEFHQIVNGGDYGWPYTFFDTKLGKRVLAPEYGGDTKKEPEPASIRIRWSRFPRTGRLTTCCSIGQELSGEVSDGAFIAFHGSWNRAPEPQAGYKVVFQPMKDGKPNGPYEVFADGFAGEMKDNSPRNAQYRPSVSR
jgi:glucose/arabinose dehydrogenase